MKSEIHIKIDEFSRVAISSSRWQRLLDKRRKNGVMSFDPDDRRKYSVERIVKFIHIHITRT